jgi:amidase|tara:strand:- start:381 stop:1805 length:1425 start_codon:yes stop_codon:yes gene_type:complete
MNTLSHSFSDDVLGDLDATDIAALIAKKKATPGEVIAAAIARSKRVAPAIHAVVDECYEEAMALNHINTAAPFAGVPTFIKDLCDVAGMHTRYGSAAFSRVKPAKRNDRLVDQFVDLGLVVLGKSSTPEFGFICSAEPGPEVGEPTRNPWNTQHSAGGSSSGAAALVAGGVVPIAHAADGGGSIRIPASACGLVGLKPSRGRIHPAKLFKSQLVRIATDGVVTRSVRDTAHFYSEIEKLHYNTKLEPVGTDIRPLSRKLRFGVVIESVRGLGIDASTQQAMEETTALLSSLGHHVEAMQIPAPDTIAEDVVHYWQMNAFLSKKVGGKAMDPSFDPSRLTPVSHGLAGQYSRSILRTPGVLYRLRKSYSDYAKIFHSIDILVTPCVNHLTPKIGHLSETLDCDTLFGRVRQWAGFSAYANVTGGPSISLPLSHNTPTNLPIGILFNANHGCDRLLLELAYQLEEAQPWRKIQDDG